MGASKVHRQFRKSLDSAEGQSEFVIVANLDIRGFSDWSQEVESVQAVSYLAKLYAVVVDRWFKRKWFFKPTGDGLLLVRSFKEKELQSLANETLEGCLEIVRDFGSLCKGQPMLNFGHPQDIGIGLAQGAASRLVSRGRTLDYSGGVLNRASRLMDLARPRGIVFDAGLAAGLLSEDLMNEFDPQQVYLRGVSPKEPVDVFFLSSQTKIPKENLSPLGEITWGTPIVAETTLRKMETPAVTWVAYALPSKPDDPSQIECSLTYPAVDGRGRRLKSGTTTDWRISDTKYVEYRETGMQFRYRLDRHAIAERLRGDGVKGPWPVRIRIDFPV